MPSEIEVYEIRYTEGYNKDIKRFVKKKRFMSLPAQMQELEAEMEKGNLSGDILTRSDSPVPYDVYKKRLPNPDTNVGQSNGYRLIYFARHDNKIIVFITIYYKKEQETISDSYIQGWIDALAQKELAEEE
ncbi:MAG: type II toxin-antitoxin system RelE/ParE family toxin [Oscillospiraceae bacterium]|jgi:mRNA-degrading endonuclease RelE of RelBE toxin-antitoxin system|nr:type II toxin-antitoxin system RelE/ParE family toxin [Oscillospiraceae bacterium]